MKLLIASNNKHKTEEIREILSGKFDEIISLRQAGIECDPDETGATFLENALIKVNAAFDALAKKRSTSQNSGDFAVLADDTGLCVDALGGAPGVHSARYADANGETHIDAANRAKLLCELQNFNATNYELRRAHFECVVALRFPDGKLLSSFGRVNGHILEGEQGKNGFGYDSLFFCDELQKTFAEASAEEKNSVSHRGRALQNLLKLL